MYLIVFFIATSLCYQSDYSQGCDYEENGDLINIKTKHDY